jgi:hypothetical protein
VTATLYTIGHSTRTLESPIGVLLIADAALPRGAQVVDLIDRSECVTARLSAIARAEDATPVYEAGQPRLIDEA